MFSYDHQYPPRSVLACVSRNILILHHDNTSCETQFSARWLPTTLTTMWSLTWFLDVESQDCLWHLFAFATLTIPNLVCLYKLAWLHKMFLDLCLSCNLHVASLTARAFCSAIPKQHRARKQLDHSKILGWISSRCFSTRLAKRFSRCNILHTFHLSSLLRYFWQN